MNNIKMKFMLRVAMLFSIATLAFADGAAPVYDADDYSPQAEENQSDASESQVTTQAYVAPAPAQQKVAQVEQQTSKNSADASARVNSLQSEVQSLRGQVEELSHQVQQLQTQVRTNYVDLDKRLSHPPVVAPAKAVAVSTENAKTVEKSTKKEVATKEIDQPNVAEEQQIYQTAYNYIKSKKYNEAVTALQSMLQKYPSGQFAANAHYWLGELYGLMSKNEQSATEFGAVVKDYPDSPKVSDAQLKLGLIYVTQMKWSEAKSAFKKVINKYPGSASARVAADQLKQIKLANH